MSIFTTPISINENMQFYFNEELMMEAEKIKEFLLLIIFSSLLYFFLVNIYHKEGLWKKVYYSSLILLGSFSLFMAIFLATNSIPYL